MIVEITETTYMSIPEWQISSWREPILPTMLEISKLNRMTHGEIIETWSTVDALTNSKIIGVRSVFLDVW